MTKQARITRSKRSYVSRSKRGHAHRDMLMEAIEIREAFEEAAEWTRTAERWEADRLLHSFHGHRIAD